MSVKFSRYNVDPVSKESIPVPNAQYSYGSVIPLWFDDVAGVA